MTNSTTPAASRPPVWQTEPCPPWCETSQHTDDQAPEDRFHYSVEQTVPLRHEKAVKMVDGTWQLDVLKLFLSLEYRGGETVFELCHGDVPVATLALDEVEQVAEKMAALVREARR